MTKMEIATYLGVNAALLSESYRSNPDPDTAEINTKILQAIQEAQLIMYELAREDIIAQCSGEVK